MRTPNFRCADCNVDTLEIQEFYMVHHDLWKSAMAGRRLLCIGCLETRIGRRIIADDFLPVPANLSDKQSARLSDRLAGFAEEHAGAIMDALWTKQSEREKARKLRRMLR